MMIISKSLKGLTLILLVLTSSLCNAQHNHGGDEGHETAKPIFKQRTPQHGGQIVAAGKYKLEVITDPLQKDEKLTVYVLRKNFKYVNLAEATAKIKIKYKDGNTDSLTMQMRNDRFVITDIDLARPLTVFFDIRLGSKLITATYYYGGLKKYRHEYN